MQGAADGRKDRDAVDLAQGHRDVGRIARAAAGRVRAVEHALALHAVEDRVELVHVHADDVYPRFVEALVGAHALDELGDDDVRVRLWEVDGADGLPQPARCSVSVAVRAARFMNGGWPVWVGLLPRHEDGG